MKYPKGEINQHKALATGAPLETCDTSDKETVPDPWGESCDHPGKVRKSGTSTGSGGGGDPTPQPGPNY